MNEVDNIIQEWSKKLNKEKKDEPKNTSINK